MSIIAVLAVPAWITMVLLYFLEDFNLIEGGLHVVGATLLNFNGYVGIVVEVLAEPNCGKMSPSKFLHHHVAVEQALTNMHGVVATDLIVFDSFVLRIVVLIELQQELMEVVQRRARRFHCFTEILCEYSFVEVVLWIGWGKYLL